MKMCLDRLPAPSDYKHKPTKKGGTHVRNRALCALALFLALSTTANAVDFEFFFDPFRGSTALTTPGRQVVGGEPFIDFNTATDRFVLGRDAFHISEILFANDVVTNLPTSGVNVIVLETFDNDADPITPFGAGNAATLIANQITAPGPGLFIYFNSNLNLPRLVYSTDLDDPTADLKIIARMVNLLGNPGALASFTEANFAAIPEPSSLLLIMTGGVLWAGSRLRRRARR
jgi:hypothetical protein